MAWNSEILPLPVSATGEAIRALDRSIAVLIPGSLGPAAMTWSASGGLVSISPLPLPDPPAGAMFVSGMAEDVDGGRDDLFVVGYTSRYQIDAGKYERMMLWHWDGAAWDEVQFNEEPGGRLYGVSVAPSRDVFVVGALGELPAPTLPVAFRLENPIRSWASIRGELDLKNPSPKGAVFRGVSAMDRSDAWAVGSSVDGPIANGVACHSDDGRLWVEADLPPSRTLTSLQSVQMIAHDDVWAVGTFEDDNGVLQAYMVHWDGRAWSESPAPHFEKSLLWDVAALGTNDVVAVGAYWTRDLVNPLVLRWNGSVWTHEQVPQIALPNGYLPIYPAGNQYLKSVSVADDSYWATGPMILGWGGHRILSARPG